MLTPSWFGGNIHVSELDGMTYVGQGIQRPDDEEDQRRQLANHVASRMRALSDPIRASILLHLAHEPASVTEQARHLHLSQPTVSGHLQVLREAGLLDERSVGRSSRLSANEKELRALLTRSQEELVKHFRR